MLLALTAQVHAHREGPLQHMLVRAAQMPFSFMKGQPLEQELQEFHEQTAGQSRPCANCHTMAQSPLRDVHALVVTSESSCQSCSQRVMPLKLAFALVATASGLRIDASALNASVTLSIVCNTDDGLEPHHAHYGPLALDTVGDVPSNFLAFTVVAPDEASASLLNETICRLLPDAHAASRKFRMSAHSGALTGVAPHHPRYGGLDGNPMRTRDSPGNWSGPSSALIPVRAGPPVDPFVVTICIILGIVTILGIVLLICFIAICGRVRDGEPTFDAPCLDAKENGAAASTTK